MAKKGWFGLSEEEREIDRKRLLTLHRDHLRYLAQTLMSLGVLSEDREAEVYSRLVEHALHAHMYLNKGDRPYEEVWLMNELAWARMKLKREIREEMEEDELDERLG
jgi:hypothetical protein